MHVFHSLRAEDEPWLPKVFVPPIDYSLISERASAIVYSDAGGGRSAVLAMLKHETSGKEDKTGHVHWIAVSWEPDPPEQWDEHEVQHVWRKDVLAHCALGLLEHFSFHPDAWRRMPGWGQSFVLAFILAFPPPMLAYELDRLKEDAADAGVVWHSHLQHPPPSVNSLQTTLQRQSIAQIIRRLVSVLNRAGIQGIWVLMDGFERWEANIDLDRPRVKTSLERFFSTLAFFDYPGFAFKMAAPQTWRRLLSRTHAVSTRRVQEFELHWSEEALQTITERRLTLASGGKITSLTDLCEAPEVSQWLKRYGADNPRRWLAWTGDLYRAYLEAGGERPLPAEQWAKLRSRLVPRLRITPDRRVFVGSMEVTGLSESLYRVLEYLYEHSGEVCSRQALYQAYRPDEALPHGWENVMETVVWRLRQAIEPDPKHPMFIITERGRGIRLLRTR